MRIILLIIALSFALARAYPVADTVLFSVKLSEDSTSLFYCDRNVPIRKMLAGPLIVDNGGLLFYSQYGYVLYSPNGTVLDSHSVRSEAPVKKAENVDGSKFICLLDTSTILYAAKTSDPKRPLIFSSKQLLKKKFKEFKDEESGQYKPLLEGAVINLARGGTADEMAPRVTLRPQLVGFSGVIAQCDRWWSLDRFYSFASPTIHERDSQFVSFFPGLGASRKTLKDKSVDVIGTYSLDGRRRYVGVWAPMGGDAWLANQMLYICDHAGNVMLRDSVIKFSATEIVIGRDNDPKRPTIYYAKANKEFAFPPAVDEHGTVFYAVLDYDARSMTIRRRSYGRFAPVPSEPELAHMIDIEKDISFEPLSLPCAPALQSGAMIPLVRFTDHKGERRTADVRDLTRGEHVVRIARQVYRDIETRLARGGRTAMPGAIERIRDTIGTIATAGCPYSLSLTGPRGVLRTLDFGLGEEILCARVLAVRQNGEIVVRVDLERYAEILVFEPDGTLPDRFIFNRQPVTQRNDIVVALGSSPIIELDYEQDPIKGTFLAWDMRAPR